MALTERVIFFHKNPDQDLFIQELREVSGMNLFVEELDEYSIDVKLYQDASVSESIALTWIPRRKGQETKEILELKEILQEKFYYPFPEMEQCIYIESSDFEIAYLLKTSLWILINLEGSMDKDYTFPEWIGKSYNEVNRSKPSTSILSFLRKMIEQ
jgi:hypothetical protein